jgi:hypothetical protein
MPLLPMFFTSCSLISITFHQSFIALQAGAKKNIQALREGGAWLVNHFDHLALRICNTKNVFNIKKSCIMC